MDHSIKKKPEKPRMRRCPETAMYVCLSPGILILENSSAQAYKSWQRTRAALNKHEEKS